MDHHTVSECKVAQKCHHQDILKVLGLSGVVSCVKVKDCYITLAYECHPRRKKSSQADEEFATLTKACFDYLSDPVCISSLLGECKECLINSHLTREYGHIYHEHILMQEIYEENYHEVLFFNILKDFIRRLKLVPKKKKKKEKENTWHQDISDFFFNVLQRDQFVRAKIECNICRREKRSNEEEAAQAEEYVNSDSRADDAKGSKRKFPVAKSKEVIPLSIQLEIDRQSLEDERRKRDLEKNQVLQDAKNKKLEKRVKKAARRKIQKSESSQESCINSFQVDVSMSAAEKQDIKVDPQGSKPAVQPHCHTSRLLPEAGTAADMDNTGANSGSSKLTASSQVATPKPLKPLSSVSLPAGRRWNLTHCSFLNESEYQKILKFSVGKYCEANEMDCEGNNNSSEKSNLDPGVSMSTDPVWDTAPVCSSARLGTFHSLSGSSQKHVNQLAQGHFSNTSLLNQDQPLRDPVTHLAVVPYPSQHSLSNPDMTQNVNILSFTEAFQRLALQNWLDKPMCLLTDTMHFPLVNYAFPHTLSDPKPSVPTLIDSSAESGCQTGFKQNDLPLSVCPQLPSSEKKNEIPHDSCLPTNGTGEDQCDEDLDGDVYLYSSICENKNRKSSRETVNKFLLTIPNKNVTNMLKVEASPSPKTCTQNRKTGTKDGKTNAKDVSCPDQKRDTATEDYWSSTRQSFVPDHWDDDLSSDDDRHKENTSDSVNEYETCDSELSTPLSPEFDNFFTARTLETLVKPKGVEKKKVHVTKSKKSSLKSQCLQSEVSIRPNTETPPHLAAGAGGLQSVWDIVENSRGVKNTRYNCPPHGLRVEPVHTQEAAPTHQQKANPIQIKETVQTLQQKDGFRVDLISAKKASLTHQEKVVSEPYQGSSWIKTAELNRAQEKSSLDTNCRKNVGYLEPKIGNPHSLVKTGENLMAGKENPGLNCGTQVPQASLSSQGFVEKVFSQPEIRHQASRSVPDGEENQEEKQLGYKRETQPLPATTHCGRAVHIQETQSTGGFKSEATRASDDDHITKTSLVAPVAESKKIKQNPISFLRAKKKSSSSKEVKDLIRSMMKQYGSDSVGQHPASVPKNDESRESLQQAEQKRVSHPPQGSNVAAPQTSSTVDGLASLAGHPTNNVLVESLTDNHSGAPQTSLTSSGHDSYPRVTAGNIYSENFKPSSFVVPPASWSDSSCKTDGRFNTDGIGNSYPASTAGYALSRNITQSCAGVPTSTTVSCHDCFPSIPSNHIFGDNPIQNILRLPQTGVPATSLTTVPGSTTDKIFSGNLMPSSAPLNSYATHNSAIDPKMSAAWSSSMLGGNPGLQAAMAAPDLSVNLLMLSMQQQLQTLLLLLDDLETKVLLLASASTTGLDLVNVLKMASVSCLRELSYQEIEAAFDRFLPRGSRAEKLEEQKLSKMARWNLSPPVVGKRLAAGNTHLMPGIGESTNSVYSLPSMNRVASMNVCSSFTQSEVAGQNLSSAVTLDEVARQVVGSSLTLNQEARLRSSAVTLNESTRQNVRSSVAMTEGTRQNLCTSVKLNESAHHNTSAKVNEATIDNVHSHGKLDEFVSRNLSSLTPFKEVARSTMDLPLAMSQTTDQNRYSMTGTNMYPPGLPQASSISSVEQNRKTDPELSSRHSCTSNSSNSRAALLADILDNLTNVNDGDCLSNEQLDLLLQKLPPVPVEENWSDGISSWLQAIVSSRSGDHSGRQATGLAAQAARKDNEFLESARSDEGWSAPGDESCPDRAEAFEEDHKSAGDAKILEKQPPALKPLRPPMHRQDVMLRSRLNVRAADGSSMPSQCLPVFKAPLSRSTSIDLRKNAPMWK